MLICGANDVIGVGQYGYTAVYSGAGVLPAVLGYWYCWYSVMHTVDMCVSATVVLKSGISAGKC